MYIGFYYCLGSISIKCSSIVKHVAIFKNNIVSRKKKQSTRIYERRPAQKEFELFDLALTAGKEMKRAWKCRKRAVTCQLNSRALTMPVILR